MSQTAHDQFEARRLTTTLAQREAADPAGSAWVSANAGTGKTKVLTDRVIRLLLEGVEPQKILCLTFTKTAAAEMAKRLFDVLGKWTTLGTEDLLEAIRKLDPDVEAEGLPRARRLFAKALETPGGLKIQTIHAFCQSLLERFPLEAGVRPGSEVLDDASARGFQREAELALFASTSPAVREALERLAVRYEGFGFQELLREIRSKRRLFQQVTFEAGGAAGLRAALLERLGLPADASLAGLDAEDIAAFDAARETLRHVAEVLAQGSKTDVDRNGALLEALGLTGAEATDAYRKIILTKDGTPRKTLMTKKIADANPSLHGFLEDEKLRIVGFEDRRRTLCALVVTLDVISVAQVYLDAYEQQKTAHGLMDYDDLIDRANLLLQQPGLSAWVHYKLDGGIEHILVDEAQDTNPGQWDVVCSLAEEFFTGLSAHDEGAARRRTIFAVGDEKQSIYSFQGAEPDRFDAMRSFFAQKVEEAGQTFKSLELILSFRSTQEVLDAVDQVFADPDMAREITASGVVPRHEADRYQVPGLVELWPTVRPEDTDEVDPWTAPVDRPPLHSPRAVVAETIAAQIDHWIKTGEEVTPGGKTIQPGHILILVQRRNSFVDEMVRALKARGIPVAGRDRMVLMEQIAVMDLLALAQFALLPEDDLTLATVLRSPFVGLSEESLFELAYPRRERETLWAALMRRRGEADFSVAADELEAVLARVEVLRPFEFFAEALGPGVHLETSGRERLLARLGYEAADPIDEFLAHALSFEQSGVPSLQGFVHEMKSNTQEIKRDFDPEPREVRIMTVHGAKGLEGKIVFLPDTCAMPASRGDGSVLGFRDQAGVFPFFALKKEEADEATRAHREEARQSRIEEQRRLLYVAMTRAEDRLYIAGYETKKNRPEGCWYSLIEAALQDSMVEAERFDGTPVLRLERSDAQETEAGEGDDAGAEGKDAADAAVLPPVLPAVLPVWITQPVAAEPPPLRFAPSTLQTAVLGEEESRFEPPTLSPLAGQRGRRFQRGLAVHRLLELLPDVDVPARREAARLWLSAPGRGFEEDEVLLLVDEVMAVLEDPDFADLFGPSSLAEVPIAGRLPGTEIALNGSIDRAWFGETEVLLIDFKTNRPPPLKVEDVDRLYITQMASYKALIEALCPGKRVRAALLWTDGTRLMEIPEAMMDAVLERIRGAET